MDTITLRGAYPNGLSRSAHATCGDRAIELTVVQGYRGGKRLNRTTVSWAQRSGAGWLAARSIDCASLDAAGRLADATWMQLTVWAAS